LEKLDKIPNKKLSIKSFSSIEYTTKSTNKKDPIELQEIKKSFIPMENSLKNLSDDESLDINQMWELPQKN